MFKKSEQNCDYFKYLQTCPLPLFAFRLFIDNPLLLGLKLIHFDLSIFRWWILFSYRTISHLSKLQKKKRMHGICTFSIHIVDLIMC